MQIDLIITLSVIIIVIYLIYTYNTLVSLNASVHSSWSDIDVQLKKRYNIIPSLVQSVKAYTSYETEAFETIIKARKKAQANLSIDESIKLSNSVTSSFSKIFALSEDYPTLKANKIFIKLQNELSEVEEDIENARRYYNAVVRDYNTKVESFPDNIIANKYHFTTYRYFEIDTVDVDKVRKTPTVNL